MTEHYHSKGTADENIESLDISTKSCQSDFATAIDVKNENFIAGEIKRAFPDHEVSCVYNLDRSPYQLFQ
jgi:fructose-1,6-bisphosphatase/inositol monophosphatase family enzyme